MDREWTGRETADEALAETVDENIEYTWEGSMEDTQDEEEGVRKQKAGRPAARTGARIEARHIRILIRELLPYVILAACMGLLTTGALAFRRDRTERMGREILQEYEEQFLHE